MTSNQVSRPINSGRSNAITPALSLTKRTLWVVRSSTRGTGQPVPFSTTSIRQICGGAVTGASLADAGQARPRAEMRRGNPRRREEIDRRADGGRPRRTIGEEIVAIARVGTSRESHRADGPLHSGAAKTEAIIGNRQVALCLRCSPSPGPLGRGGTMAVGWQCENAQLFEQ